MIQTSWLTTSGATCAPWVKIIDSHLRGAGGGDKSIAEYVLEHVERLAPWQKWRP